MIILDTDTLSIAQHPDSPAAIVLHARIVALPEDIPVATTIISYEEQLRGWLSFLAKSTTKPAQLNAYFKLFKHLQGWRKVNVLPFDEMASHTLDHLRTLKLRIGTYDLKIASIALSLDATLLTRNRQHFSKIPNLRIEDWTKP